MLTIEKIDHIGIRIQDKIRSMAFYEKLGFKTLSDSAFEHGGPIIMQHPSGIVLNLLGPAIPHPERNVLMDISEKYAGYTHMSLKVSSLEDAKQFMKDEGIVITETMSYKDLNAFFIRDPDGNVIEFDYYSGEQPAARTDSEAYNEHP